MKYFSLAFGLMLAILFSCNSNQKKKDTQKALVAIEVPKVVTADIEAGIKANIAKKVEEDGGYFTMNANGKELRLQLVRVHTEYLSSLGPRRHFACVDLADVSGDVYDVDFFLEGDPGNMTVTETTLHKLNGKPFYTWKQRDDKTWYKMPVQDATKDLLGVVEGEDQFEFSYEVTLPKMEETTNMWIPVPQSDRFQTIELVSSKTPVEYVSLEDKYNKNKVLHMRFSPEHSGKMVKLVYDVKRKEK